MSRSEGSCERNAMTFVSCSRVTLDGSTGDSEADQEAGHDTEGNAQRNRVRSLGRRRITPNRRCIGRKSAGGSCSALQSASDCAWENSARSRLACYSIDLGQDMLTEDDRIRLIHDHRTALLNLMFEELCRKPAHSSAEQVAYDIIATASNIQNALSDSNDIQH